MSGHVESDLAEPPGDLGGFPIRTLRGGTRLFRIHHRGLGPCWCSSARPDEGHGGRFDLPAPDGTSYWALQPEAAFLETIVSRPVTVVPLDLLDRSSLSIVEVPRDLVFANTPVKRARGLGLTGEFPTTVVHATTRRWAASLPRAGHRGLLAIPRHDVTGRLRTAALFGRAGEHVPRGWASRLETRPIPADAVDAMAHWGIRAVPVPFEVETVDPPR